MGGIFGGGGQTQPATYSRGGNPAAYIPYNQPGQDQLYNQLLTGLASPSLSFMQNEGALPATQYWPSAQGLAGQIPTYASELGGGNPYVNPLIYFANQAGQQANTAGQQQASVGGNIINQAGTLLPYLQNLSQNAFGSNWQNLVSGAQNNPYYNQALGGAQTAAGIGGNAAGQLASQIPQILSAGQQVYGTAFDPQQALYNQLVNQQSQQSAAENAMSGLSGTPYGANLSNQALQNLAINWQNQQLGRQSQGLQGLEGAGSSALGLGQGAAGLAAGAAALPSNVYTNQQAQILQMLNAANQAGIGGAGAMGGLLGAYGGLAGQGAQLQNLGINTQAQAGALPYNAYLTQAQNALQGLNTGLGGLGSAINIGNQQFQIPQQALNDIQSYLGLGQAASGLAGQLGAQGFNQNQAGLSNIAALGGLGYNALFGNAGIGGSSGLLGGLLGGGAGGLVGPALGDYATGIGAAGGLSAADLLGLPFFG